MNKKNEIEKKHKSLKRVLDEKQIRLWAATEARALGHGGIVTVSAATGLSEKTISRGLQEITSRGRPPKEDPVTLNGSRRVRAKGGGRKSAIEKQPGILEELEKLINPATRGDPESPLKWTSKSLVKLSAELKAKGFSASTMVVANLLKQLGYSLQGNSKVLDGASHEDRDAQFNHISDQAIEVQEAGNPVISVDTKKKELIGNFKNNGKEWEPAGSPVLVKSHDFQDPELGKVAPYGVYDIFGNSGWVSVGVSSDTAEFAVSTISKWWEQMGKETYPNATEIMITADCGGSNGNRNRLWKTELQALADKLNLKIRVCHFPPGTSKWNKIEHRMFSHISINWRGKPLLTREVVVNLIASTRTKSNLSIQAELDEKNYEKGKKISDKELEKINILKNNFHGEWNYIISPRSNT